MSHWSFYTSAYGIWRFLKTGSGQVVQGPLMTGVAIHNGNFSSAPLESLFGTGQLTLQVLLRQNRVCKEKIPIATKCLLLVWQHHRKLKPDCICGRTLLLLMRCYKWCYKGIYVFYKLAFVFYSPKITALVLSLWPDLLRWTLHFNPRLSKTMHESVKRNMGSNS